MTINVTPINDISVSENAADTRIDLFENFDDPRTTGRIARFAFEDESLAGGIANVVLFDQAEAGAPLTVENFQNYVERQDYDASFIHRSIPGFVVQGGGFRLEDSLINFIETDEPVVNEFNPERSNLRGTIAVAKQAGNPDSGTSQWFFNLTDNSNSLDNQNGGFTVFGELQGTADEAVIDAIAAIPTQDASNVSTAFSNLPIQPDSADDGDFGLVELTSVSISQASELSFDLIENSNPDLVTASIEDNTLVLDYVDEQSGSAELVIEATNLLGETVQDTFSITIAADEDPGEPRLPTPETPETPEETPDTPVLPTNPFLGTVDSDVLVGGTADDKLIGLAGDDTLSGDIGNDILRGGQGQDILAGATGRDRLFGGNGADQLDGGIGQDTLDGGRGADQLFGGQGQDVFVIKPGQGRDQIRDFTSGVDKLQITGLSFQQLTITQFGDNTMIRAGAQELALLKNVDAEQVSQADFLAG